MRPDNSWMTGKSSLRPLPEELPTIQGLEKSPQTPIAGASITSEQMESRRRDLDAFAVLDTPMSGTRSGYCAAANARGSKTVWIEFIFPSLT